MTAADTTDDIAASARRCADAARLLDVEDRAAVAAILRRIERLDAAITGSAADRVDAAAELWPTLNAVGDSAAVLSAAGLSPQQRRSAADRLTVALSGACAASSAATRLRSQLATSP